MRKQETKKKKPVKKRDLSHLTQIKREEPNKGRRREPGGGDPHSAE